jgi:hypothetical protein
MDRLDLPLDKIAHALAGALIGNTGVMLAMALIGLDGAGVADFVTAYVVGVGLAAFAGWGKEQWDREGHGSYDVRDFWATAGGGCIGSFGAVLALIWIGARIQ